MNGEASERLWAFLQAHNTMTVATVGPAGEPQAAAVFYAADRNLNLYFLSSPNSRHSQNLLREPRVAATIQADGQQWQEIQGLQIEGSACPVEGSRQIIHAWRVYAGRFPFLKGLVDGAVNRIPQVLRGPVANSRFYVLEPNWIRLIDNRQAFGYKIEWRWVNGRWERANGR